MAVGFGANWFPDACVSGSVGFTVGVWVMFGVVVSPVFGASIPGSIETGFEMRGMEATRSAYPSYWPSGVQLFCW